ncbi:MAG: hypothetical protein VX641_07080 [Planctomycetota bacterium]|nr:hypothetical protein [Planctomycetota bacterium]
MNWAIVYLAGACCLVSASCARETAGSSLRILRGAGSLLILGGGVPMLLDGAAVEVLLVGSLCVVVMAFATRTAKVPPTAWGWFLPPVLLVITALTLLPTVHGRHNDAPPRILFNEEAMRREQLVILEDAWTELELLEERGFPRATREARESQDWTRLGDLETVRGTIPMLQARIIQLRRELAEAPPEVSRGQEVRSVAERVGLLDAFVNPSD